MFIMPCTTICDACDPRYNVLLIVINISTINNCIFGLKNLCFHIVQSFETIDVCLIDCCKLAQNVLSPQQKKSYSFFLNHIEFCSMPAETHHEVGRCATSSDGSTNTKQHSWIDRFLFHHLFHSYPINFVAKIIAQ